MLSLIVVNDHLRTPVDAGRVPHRCGPTERRNGVMRHAMALNGSFFNTERMVDQYVRKAYFE
jgi:hypothetical protein